MAKQLTRAQFQQQYGMTVEEYQAMQNAPKQQAVTPVVNETSVPQAAPQNNAKPSLAQAVRNETPNFRHMSDEDLIAAEQVTAGEVAGAAAQQVDRTARNVAAGVLSIPSAVALPAVVGAGFGAGYDYITQDSEEQYWDLMSQRILGKDGLEILSADAKTAAETFQKENPSATPEQIAKFNEQYLNSKEFYDKVTDQMGWLMQLARNNQDWANGITGLNLRSDQMTAGDEVTQAVGGALVGLTPGVVSGIRRYATKVVGNRVMDHIATRVALKVAEVATPLTLPYSASNVALNAGVGAAMTEGIRYLTDEETLFDYDAMFNKFAKDDAVPAAVGLGLAALNPVALGRAVRKNVEDQTTAAIKNITEKNTGRSLQTQDSDGLTPTLNPATGLEDEISSATHAAQNFGANADELADVEIAALRGSLSSRKEVENRIVAYGELDPGYTTVPLETIERDIASLGNPNTVRAFNEYLHAITRQQDEAIQARQYQQQTMKKLDELSNAKLAGNAQAVSRINAELDELQKANYAIRIDAPESRSSLSQWSRADVNNIIQAGNSDPRFRGIKDKIVKYSNDMLEYAHRQGRISKSELTEMRNNRPLYYPLVERAMPDIKEGAVRSAALFGKRIKERFGGNLGGKGNAPDVLQSRGRNLDVRAEGKVDLPADVIPSLRAMTADLVQEVQINASRRDFINIVRNLPNAEGKLLRAYEFKSGNSTAKSVTREQFQALQAADALPDLNKYTMYQEGGRIYLWEFADQSLTDLFKFQPSISVPVMNQMRRIFQAGMTTYNPAFAAIQFIREPQIAGLTKPADRSLGWLNTFTHRLLEGSSLDGTTAGNAIRAASNMDPLGLQRYASAATQIGVQVWQRTTKELARRIADDLANDRGIFSAITQLTGGKEFVQNVANKMLISIENTAHGIMTRRMSNSFGHMSAIEPILDDYNAAVKSSRGVVRTSLDMYKALLESIQNSTRAAFWSENLGTLSRKYGGFDKIPEKELARLELDTRNLGGDMSRRSKSKFIQGATSVIPYGNTAIQGTRHFIAAALPNSVAQASNKHLGTNFLLGRQNHFWQVATAGIFMPVMASMAVMDEWKEAQRWWYQDQPSWKQASMIIIPTVEAVKTRATTGEWPKGDPSQYFNQIPISPEMLLLKAPFESALRATGLFGETEVPLPDTITQMRSAMTDLVSVPTPPIIGVGLANMGMQGDLTDMIGGQAPNALRDTPYGGAHGQNVTPDNTMTQAAFNMIGAIGGTLVRDLADALNVTELSYNSGDGLASSLGKGLRTFTNNQVQRLPNMPSLYKTQERKYTYTADAEYVGNVERELEPVFKQLTFERDTKGIVEFVEGEGGRLGAPIKDQGLKQIADYIYQTINRKGDYKTADEAYSFTRARLAGLQRQAMTTASYNTKRNELIRQQQIIRGTQAKILREMEKDIQTAVGQGYEQRYGEPFSFNDFVKQVKRDAAR